MFAGRAFETFTTDRAAFNNDTVTSPNNDFCLLTFFLAGKRKAPHLLKVGQGLNARTPGRVRLIICTSSCLPHDFN
ncbi:hypothetical protein D9756_010396 [Leucocoprinus leucothites]|uniref:Uncharacterized protein n=1 Tax=Leucocoprinus leucothites TaxID=201217 RepID=A0A8H5CRR0_9AGAR|nr:hypothetical protein D9756_010396 [Leucoagaricus leucothites]